MRLRAHRRNLVVWSSSVGPADRLGGLWLTRPTRNRRVRRFIRISALFTVLGLVRLARGAWPRGRHMLVGVVLTVVGIVLRSQPAGLVLLPGLLFLFSAPLVPAVPRGDRELKRELAAYSTPAQRCDLEAILDEYPDEDTSELRAILASQAMAAYTQRIAGTGRY
jgi:hypothetical protein